MIDNDANGKLNSDQYGKKTEGYTARVTDVENDDKVKTDVHNVDDNYKVG